MPFKKLFKDGKVEVGESSHNDAVYLRSKLISSIPTDEDLKESRAVSIKKQKWETTQEWFLIIFLTHHLSN